MNQKLVDKARVVSKKAANAAQGYLELTREIEASGGDTTTMRMAAIRELQRFTDNDELIDAMYEADMEETERRALEE